jgi:hypothetical protein
MDRIVTALKLLAAGTRTMGDLGVAGAPRAATSCTGTD